MKTDMVRQACFRATISDEVGEVRPVRETDQTRLVPLGGIGQKHAASSPLQERLLESRLGKLRRARPGSLGQPRGPDEGDVALQTFECSERSRTGESTAHPAEFPA